MGENNTTNRIIKKVSADRRLDFANFENKWMKKGFLYAATSIGSIFLVIAIGSVALYKLGLFEEVLAEKVDKEVHTQEHLTDELRVQHIEEAVLTLVEHGKVVDKRIEDVNYSLQTRQDKQFKVLLEAIEK